MKNKEKTRIINTTENTVGGRGGHRMGRGSGYISEGCGIVKKWGTVFGAVFVVIFWGVFPAFGGGYGPYLADVVSVYDGDTLTADVQVWPGQVNRVHVRIDGIDTPEIRGKCAAEKDGAKRARAAMIGILEGGRVSIVHVRTGKYASRMVAEVLVDGVDVAGAMIRRGLAREYHGGKRAGWCD